MAGCRRSGSTYLRDIRGGEVRPRRRPAARHGRAAGRFPCLVVEPRRRGDPEPYGRLPIRGVARLGVVDEVAGDGQLGVVAHGDLLLWVGAVTSRPLVHSPLGGWRGCPPPHSAPPRAAGGSGSREKAESFRPPKRPARRRRVFRPLDAEGRCAERRRLCDGSAGGGLSGSWPPRP